MKKYLVVLVVIAAIIVFTILYFTQKKEIKPVTMPNNPNLVQKQLQGDVKSESVVMEQNNEPLKSDDQNKNQNNNDNATVSDNIKKYTMTDLAAASTKEKCYTAIDGKVYDLTAFIKLHPGGEGSVTSICGIDGTAKFSKVHSTTIAAINKLITLQIGELTK